MSSAEELRQIQDLMDELLGDFEQWGKEYKQPRDLGARGEFANLYRKARKLKTALWDSPTPPEDWREDVRTIVKEVAAHAFLLLVDLDNKEYEGREP